MKRNIFGKLIIDGATERQLTGEIRDIELTIGKLKVNHILHLILTLLTGGLWVIIWILSPIVVNSNIKALNKDLDSIYTELDTRHLAFR